MNILASGLEWSEGCSREGHRIARPQPTLSAELSGSLENGTTLDLGLV